VARPNAAGPDVGATEHWICAPTIDGAAVEVEVFGATTPELERMVELLKQRGVISVALESAGVYQQRQ